MMMVLFSVYDEIEMILLFFRHSIASTINFDIRNQKNTYFMISNNTYTIHIQPEGI